MFVAPLLAGIAGSAIGAGIASTGLIAGLTMATAVEVGWTVGTLLYSLYQMANQDVVESTYTGPRLGDLRVQSSAWGEAIPKIFGTYRVAGNIIWSLPLNETEHVEEYSTGKGGGGTKTTRIWYTYDATWTVAFSLGEMAGVNKIWFDNVLVFDGNQYYEQSGLNGENWKFYTGSTTQVPDWFMESQEGYADMPAYRGVCYIRFTAIELENWGNRIPNVTVELSSGLNIAVNYTKEPINDTLNGTYRYANSGLCPRSPNGFGLYKTGNWIVSTPLAENTSDPLTLNSVLYGVTPNNKLTYIRKIAESYTGAKKWGGSSNILCDIEGECDTDGTNYLTYREYTDSYNEVLSINFKPNVGGYISSSQLNKWYISNKYIMSPGVSGGSNLTDREVYIYDKQQDVEELKQFKIDLDDYNSADIPTGVYILEVCSDDTYAYIRTTGGYIFKINVSTKAYIDRYENIATGTNRSNTGFMTIFNGYIHLLPYKESAENQMAYYIDYNNKSSISTDISAILDNANDLTVAKDYGKFSGHNGFFVINTDDYIAKFTIFNYVSSETLAEVLAYLFDRSGVDTADYDVADLNTIDVRGYIISSASTTRDVIQQLIFTYNFEVVEIDNKLKARLLKNETISETINMSEYLSDLVYTNTLETELPKKVTFQYVTREADYSPGSQVAIRINTVSEEIAGYGTAAVITDTYAKRQAEIILYNTWSSRESFNFSIDNSKISTLNAGDIISIEVNDGYFRAAKIKKLSINTDNTLHLECISYSSDSISSTATGSDTANYIAEILLQGPTRLELLDIPNLTNTINDEGIYLAATGYTNSWRGCYVYTKKLDNYKVVGVVTTPTKMGISYNALSSGPTTLLDTTSYLDVSLYAGEIPSNISISDLFNGKNYLLVGKEIIQFADVENIGNGRYRLTNLLRGRRGTEHQVGLHTDNEVVVLLDKNMLFDTEAQATIESEYAAATFGEVVSAYNTQKITPEIICKKPLSPSLVYTVVNGTDLEIYCTRRSRYIRGNFSTLDLFEEVHAYKVEIYYDESKVFDTITRTYDSILDATNFTIKTNASWASKYTMKLIYDTTLDGYNISNPNPGTLKIVIYQITSSFIGNPVEYII